MATKEVFKDDATEASPTIYQTIYTLKPEHAAAVPTLLETVPLCLFGTDGGFFEAIM
jgi:hypothetical protein